MEKIRKKVIKKINELNEIKPRVYTALELHPKRQMMGRVQRREEMRYAKELQEQKVTLKKGLGRIGSYLGSVNRQKEHRVRFSNSINRRPQSIPTAQILPTPKIVLGRKPILRRTKPQRNKRRGRF